MANDGISTYHFKWFAGDTNILDLDGYGNLTLGNDIFAKPSNDMNLKVFNPSGGGGVAISLQNRDIDTDSKTTQFDVNPDNIRLTTDFSGAQNQWTFDNSGTFYLPSNGTGQSVIQSLAGDVYLYSLHEGTSTVQIRAKGDGGDSEWTFGDDGKLTLPAGGDIVDSNGDSVLGGGGNPFDQDLNTTDNVIFAKVSIPGVEDNSTPAVDFFSTTYPNNHVVTLDGDWTLKLKARAQGGNEGHLYLEAGGNGTRVQVNGNGSTVQIIADNGDNSGSWQFDNNGILTLPYSNYLETSDINLAVGSQGEVIIRSNAADNINNKTWTFGTDGTLTVPGTINAHDLIKGRDKVGDYYSWNITGLAMLDIEYGFTQGDLTIDGLWPLAGKVQVVISGIAVPAEGRVVVVRDVAGQRLPREPARLEGLGAELRDAGRGELDRKRDALEPPAQPHDRLDIVGADPEVAILLPHAQHQALPDLVEGERVDQGVQWIVDFHQVFKAQSGLRKIS